MSEVLDRLIYVATDLTINGNEKFGNICHKAADRIRELEAQLAAIDKQREREKRVEGVINHIEAKELAELKAEDSNLARCYLDLSAQLAELKKGEPVAWIGNDGKTWEYGQVKMLQDSGYIHDLTPLYLSPVIPEKPAYMVNCATGEVKPVIPEGWMLVPKEPTKEMIIAAHTAAKTWSDECDAGETLEHMITSEYKAMLSAVERGE